MVECLTFNERKRIMKKTNYIQPATEVITINTAYGICQSVSKNAPLNNGGGATGTGGDNIDPGMGL